MGEDPNLFEPHWERELQGARGVRLGAAAGSLALGCTLFELDPGAQAAPYHTHYANDELLIVLAGELELRSPDGRRPLRPGAVVAFPAGPDGAHRLRNVSAAPARYLMISTMRFPDVAEHPDTGTVLAITGPGEGYAFPGDAAADWLTLAQRAIAAEP